MLLNVNINDFFMDIDSKSDLLVDWLASDYQKGADYIQTFTPEFIKLFNDSSYSIKYKYNIAIKFVSPICAYLYSRDITLDLEKVIVELVRFMAVIIEQEYDVIDLHKNKEFFDFPLELIEELSYLNDAYIQPYREKKLQTLMSVITIRNKQNRELNKVAKNNMENIAHQITDGVGDVLKKAQKRFDELADLESKGAELLHQDDMQNDRMNIQEPDVLDEIKNEVTVRKKVAFWVYIGSVIDKFKQEISYKTDMLSAKIKLGTKSKVSVKLKDSIKRPGSIEQVLSAVPDQEVQQTAQQQDTSPSDIDEIEEEAVITEADQESQKAVVPQTYDNSQVLEDVLKKHHGALDSPNEDADEDW
jgi:hypothetical protein